MTHVMDVIAALLLLCGSILCLCAAIGLVRFPDLLSRMHAAAKPQVLGVLLVAAGVALEMHTLSATAMMVLVVAFQLLTAPVASHMMSRAALRAGQVVEPEDHRG